MDAAEVAPADRRTALGAGWEKSGDVAWTTTGDAAGFHLLIARESDGYAWKTAATLVEPGFDADAWIGNACVTGSGQRAVVVYAPRTFTNKPKLMARGGFTAVVDLASGRVTKLDLQASLSYYNPGCGTGETAVLTQSGGEDKPGTRLVRLDAATGRLSTPVETRGQVTSAVPAADGKILGAARAGVIEVDAAGRGTVLARTDGVPYRLTPDGKGGVVFLDKDGATARVKRLPRAAVTSPDAQLARPVVLAQGPAMETGLTRAGGTVFATGKVARLAAPSVQDLPVQVLAGSPKDATVTTRGAGFVTQPVWGDGKGTLLLPGDSGKARLVKMSLTVRETGRRADFSVDPARRQSPNAGQGRDAAPSLGGYSADAGTVRPAKAVAAGSPTDPVEDERTCSVPRNDPRNQAMQPKPRQVEWAVDQAIKGYLNTHIQRPANWKNLGMPAYMPQELFLNPALDGGERVMAQVMLGVTTQESNMWQASRSAVPGVTGNPLIGNNYGIDLYDGSSANDWDVNFAEADCGYGITQVTDHMRMAGRENGHGGAAWPYQKQRAAALDYTANIAAGLQILADKWNQTRAAGMTVNHGNASRPENWYYALWAYNSGFYPQSTAGQNGGAWGLGWANNPANPEWDAGRLPFLENAVGGEDASAAARPQYWPYQEKVLGFVAHPPSFLESPGTMVPAFRYSTWNGSNAAVNVKGSALYNRAHVRAPEDAFCSTANSCNPGKISDGASNDTATSGPCSRADFRCWWNKPVTWKDDCVTTCGWEVVRFNETYPEEADGTAYPPTCSVSGLPAGALIVDDVPAGTPVVRPGCTNSWTNSGSFSFAFSNNGSEAVYPSKVDLHQLGAGFGGHFYFGHTRQDDAKGQRLKITGTWQLNQKVNGTAMVYVHLPDHGAQTKNATYQIDTGRWTAQRTIAQPGTGNRWVPLGAFRFSDVPRVRLTTTASDGTGDEDVAFDAIAVAPGDYKVNNSEISLPPANPNAPDIDHSDQPHEPTKETLAGVSARADGTGVGACKVMNKKAGTSLCLSSQTAFRKPTRQQLSKVRPLAKRAGELHLVKWCSEVSGNHYSRLEACLHRNVTATVFRNEKPIGQAELFVHTEISVKDGGKLVREVSTIFPTRIDKEIGSIALTWDPDCAGACKSDPPLVTGQMAWGTDGTGWPIAQAQVTHEWTGATLDKINLQWFMKVTSPSADNEPTAIWEIPDFELRCDAQVGNSPGCVFWKITPTYTVDTAKYPTASAMYWLAQTKLKSRPGSRANPLHRLADVPTQDANRRRMCQNVSAKFDPHPDTPPEVQCDEFPFAASRESGGMIPGLTGDKCAQFYGFKDAVSGRWILRDDDRVNPPAWNESCARGSITKDHNEGAGRELGVFTSKVRLLDGDAYNLRMPGFDKCTSEYCVIQTL
ncbi:hypothetical protein [Streptomyces sp. NPDC005408]|uniref:golvesin C-terminal-like domain-containing protein n=1 Tax=Streptomyces sp. NPDC005408 TaxID=3155341 RepID=UPI0033B2A866